MNYILSLPAMQPIWKAHTNHRFVLSLGRGTLPLESFKFYLIQDYHFLDQYARSLCASASKAPALPDVFAQAEYALSVREELKMHLSYCSTRFGISETEMRETPKHSACEAYTQFLWDIAGRDDWLAMQVAIAPCMYGYKVVGDFLTEWDGTVKGESNCYWDWIRQYTGPESAEAVRKSTELLEHYAAQQAPEKIEELARIFQQAAEV